MEGMVADIEAQTKKVDQLEVAAILERVKYPVTLKFEDVVYKTKINSGGWFVKKMKTEEKVILKGMTGMVKPGEMLAMLGPSGSGKTTLLTALGGRLGGLKGSITYNGKPFSNPMKRNIGFVTQDDVLYAHLTVTETLVFTAFLRLPNSLTEEEKIAHAQAVITQLGLTKCKNNIIGGPLLRGISGGERKRVSIGQEILTNPSLMFLDEPTSGLDSTTAQQIVSALWRLANGGRTIVMTIHQPSSRLFYMFDKVMLLSDGNPLYFGEASSVMDYFASIGYCPSVSMNPSDFLLDLANGVAPDKEPQEEQALKVKQILVSYYKKNLADKLKAELQEIDICLDVGSEDKQYRRWSTTWWQQCRVLFRRGFKERVQHSFHDHMKHIQVLCAAFLSALLWWKSDVSHIQDRIGLLFYYTQFWGFVSLCQAIYAFAQERLMLEKERSSGMYKLSAYFMSRILGDLPMELAHPTIYVTITYWMGGLKATPGNFLHTLFVLLYSVLVSQGVGLALGAVVQDIKDAGILGATIVSLSILAGGYFVQNVPSFIAWIKYISISHHTYKLLLGSQYKPGDTYPCGSPQGFCLVQEYPGIKKVGLDGQVISVLALAIMLVGYRLIAYVALMRIGVTRK